MVVKDERRINIGSRTKINTYTRTPATFVQEMILVCGVNCIPLLKNNELSWREIFQRLSIKNECNNIAEVIKVFC